MGPDRLAPPGSRRRAGARFLARSLPGVIAGRAELHEELAKTALLAGRPWTVAMWVEMDAATPLDLDTQRAHRGSASSMAARIHIDGIPGSAPWNTSMQSLTAQTHSNWVAVEAGAAESGPGSGTEALHDPPIIELVLTAGERLTPDALFELCEVFDARPAARAVCFDEVFSDPDRLPAARVGPSFSPISLESENLWGSGLCWRSGEMSVSDVLADPSSALRGRGFERNDVVRVPRVLKLESCWTQSGLQGAERLIADARGTGGEPGADSEVSIVVPTRFSSELLARLFEGLRATNYPHMSLVIVDNSGRDPVKEEWYESRLSGIDHQILWTDPLAPFNYSEANNAGAAAATGDLIVFLNDDIVLAEPNWLWAISTYLGRSDVGVVGAQLGDGRGAIQHGGVVIGINGLAEHLFAGASPGTNTMLGSTETVREVSAVTGAALGIRRDVFDSLGGFDRRLVLTGSDVDLCLRTADLGYSNVVVPGLGIDHVESATRGEDSITDDVFLSWWKFRRDIVATDAHFHPLLSVVRNIPSPRSPIEPTSLGLLSGHLRRPDIADPSGAETSVIDRVATFVPREPSRTSSREVTWLIPDSTDVDAGLAGDTLRVSHAVVGAMGRIGGRHDEIGHRVLVVGCDNQQWASAMVRHAAPGIGDVRAVPCRPSALGDVGAPVAVGYGLENLVSGAGAVHISDAPILRWAGLDTLTASGAPLRADPVSIDSDELALLRPAARVRAMSDAHGVVIGGHGPFERRVAMEAIVNGVPVALHPDTASELGLYRGDYVELRADHDVGGVELAFERIDRHALDELAAEINRRIVVAVDALAADLTLMTAG